MDVATEVERLACNVQKHELYFLHKYSQITDIVTNVICGLYCTILWHHEVYPITPCYTLTTANLFKFY